MELGFGCEKHIVEKRFKWEFSICLWKVEKRQLYGNIILGKTVFIQLELGAIGWDEVVVQESD
jgi:hypothetical protein